MNKSKEIYGIDISKNVFDVYSVLNGHQQFKNDEKGLVIIVGNTVIRIYKKQRQQKKPLLCSGFSSLYSLTATPW